MSLTRRFPRASRKCRLLWTVTRLFDSLFDSAVETTESIVAACCHNHAEIKADVDARVLSHAEQGIRCPGIASSDADGKLVFRGNLTFSDPQRPDTKDVICGAGELGIQVKMSTGRPRRDWEGNVSSDWCRNKDSHDQGHPTLRDRFGELVEGRDGFVGVHPEHKFQTVQVLKSRG